MSMILPLIINNTGEDENYHLHDYGDDIDNEVIMATLMSTMITVNILMLILLLILMPMMMLTMLTVMPIILIDKNAGTSSFICARWVNFKHN